MNILHLTNHLNHGGISSYVYTLALEMKRHGHESSVLTSEGSLAGRFQEANIPIYSSRLPRTKSEIDPRLYLYLPHICDFIKQRGFDILHVHTRVGQVVAGWIKLLTGIPYVTTCHGFCKNRLGRRLFPAWGNHVIAVSDALKKLLTDKFSLKNNNVTTIFNGIDIESLQTQMRLKNRDAIRRNWEIPPSRSIIISTVSRIVPVKGHEVLLRSMNQLVRRYPNLHLIISGEGPSKKRVEKITHELHLDGNVTFTGPLEDITETMAVTDIFASPILWGEAFGLSIAEAMALKIPVITTTSWELKDFYKDRDSVLLVKPGDVIGLARALEDLVINESLRRSLAANAYNIVKNKFSAKVMGTKIEKLYKRIIYYRA